MGCIDADDANIVQYKTVPNQVPQILKSVGISSFTTLQTIFCDGNLCNNNNNAERLNYGKIIKALTFGYLLINIFYAFFIE